MTPKRKPRVRPGDAGVVPAGDEAALPIGRVLARVVAPLFVNGALSMPGDIVSVDLAAFGVADLDALKTDVLEPVAAEAAADLPLVEGQEQAGALVPAPACGGTLSPPAAG